MKYGKEQKGAAQLVVLGLMALMAVAIPVATKLVGQNQENRSKAAPPSNTCGSSNVNMVKCNGGSTYRCKKSTGTYTSPSGSSYPTTSYKWVLSGNCSCGCNASGSACAGSYSGVCGSANGKLYSIKPSGNLCAKGTVTWLDASGSGGDYNWRCNGCGGGSSVKCLAKKRTNSPINGKCGSANGGTYDSKPTLGICNSGSSGWTDDKASDGTWNWKCNGSNGGNNVSCSAKKTSTPTPINGSCGSAISKTHSSKPTSDLCLKGTVKWVDSSGSTGLYKWQCLGSNGGNNISCLAKGNPVNGKCGTRMNTCVSGTFQDMTDTETEDVWSCLGKFNGSNKKCSLKKSMNTCFIDYENWVFHCDGCYTKETCQGLGAVCTWNPGTSKCVRNKCGFKNCTDCYTEEHCAWSSDCTWNPRTSKCVINTCGGENCGGCYTRETCLRVGTHKGGCDWNPETSKCVPYTCYQYSTSWVATCGGCYTKGECEWFSNCVWNLEASKCVVLE